MKLNRIINCLAIAGLLGCPTLRSEIVPVIEDIAEGTTVTWTADNTYMLNTVVYVRTNATLIIEPGTVVMGGTNAANLVARAGIPNLVSALWVTRGGRLVAEGTPEAPIIFTMEGDDVNDPEDIAATVTGQWGGVVIMGRAPINSAQYGPGNVASPKFDLYEGVEATPESFQAEHAFGGDDPEDDSGVVRYVSIRHTGNTFAPAKELNALTMGGVGRGTLIEYVETYAGSDDGFEWWGGTVNTRYLVSAFIEDDDFDTDQGYQGTNQFWFGIKPPWGGSSDSRGFETDGDLDQNNTGEEPISEWAVYNATLIGRGQADAGFGGGVGWNLRDEASPKVYNSVLAEFAEGLRLDNDGLLYATNGPAGVWNTVWDVALSGNANAEFLFTDPSYANTVEAALLGGISYAADGMLDPRPQPESPALGEVTAGAPMDVSYRGAFSGPSDNWADGWTALSQYGYLKPAMPASLPTITVQPEAAVNATVGDDVSLSIVASGDEPITYQWIKDGVDLDGAVSATLILSDVQESDSGTYAVKVTGPGGTVTSNNSVVTVGTAPLPTLWDIVMADPELSTLKGAIELVGLDAALAGEDPLTVFAPNNAAFALLPEGTLESLTPEELTAVLTYHVLAGTQLAADLVAGEYATLLEGSSVTVTTPEGMVMVNDATVIAADVLASNGVAHVIDRVLMPSAPEPPAIQPPVIADGQVTLTWTGEGEVETATEINGPWARTGNTSGSFSEEVGEGNKYYRIRTGQ